MGGMDRMGGMNWTGRWGGGGGRGMKEGFGGVFFSEGRGFSEGLVEEVVDFFFFFFFPIHYAHPSYSVPPRTPLSSLSLMLQLSLRPQITP